MVNHLILLVFPNQLFANHPGLIHKPSEVVLIEDSLFFGDARYPLRFHQQKLWLHRATMKRYQARLRDQGYKTRYLDYVEEKGSLRQQLEQLSNRKGSKVDGFLTLEPVDFMLEKRLRRVSDELGLPCKFLPNPGFINDQPQNEEYRSGKRRWFMGDFYKWQRQRLDILMDGDDPAGGSWSFDKENRKKIPRQQLASIPEIATIQHDSLDEKASRYVAQRFSDNPGSLQQLVYPTSHAAAKGWLQDFLKHRLREFGPFEDAIAEGESWLWHSVLTPSLNIGLLTPDEVVQATLRHADEHELPINSLEGFVRQIIGWREFMRATYEDLGVQMRTTNHWNHSRSMPSCFYDGTTGIAPIDDTIRRVIDTGYCHHIERLMVLGGFMFLCEIDPDEIYNWFMEMFVDSYDWVMVPNVYAMSQNADGGLITTKPYFSGSAYIRRMSHYKQAAWCDVWDGLYWRWIWNHRQELGKNPRWAMMCKSAERMSQDKRQSHLRNAKKFLAEL